MTHDGQLRLPVFVIHPRENRELVACAAETDCLMANHDYAVNLKAEIEIMALHEKFDAMRTDELHAQLQRQQVLTEELLVLERTA